MAPTICLRRAAQGQVGLWPACATNPSVRYPCICLHTFACMCFLSWRSAPLSLRLLYVFPACYCGIVESPPAHGGYAADVMWLALV